ncbi:hypothetical protein CY35_09G101900 [Sphagnum magellanicum]|nr:hypothetical protein CY35_09G101900 [Sphagnum magellanicum]KAH9553103.1 hypothetical protein CY35_09G101900 [Sphagnum magellanicum]KAH9553106.1 hypothetical protein CY35_09G101900 [Sphagnum magellanicum]KAH9553107.1 hypothetical protein CY35_09G101900 [Sphagnum magellanicum]KAH9553108.1 hypothetical protein CY35_09G101900 [Sphagnum magellanicum]
MMAFAMGSLPTSLCLSHKPLYLGLCYSPLLKGPTFHGYVGAAPLCPAVQCTAHEESDTLVQEEKHHKEVERSPSWSDPDTPTTPVAQPPPLPDWYAGWPPVDSDPKGSWKAGLLKVGAGFMLAIGFSFAAYSAYSRFGGKRQIGVAPLMMQQQQASIAEESESLDASSNKDIIAESVEEPKYDLQKERENPIKGYPSITNANIKVDTRDAEKEAQKAASEPTVESAEKTDLPSQSAVSSPSSETAAVSRVHTPASTQQDEIEEGHSISIQLTDFKKGSDISSSIVKAIDPQAGVKEQGPLEEVNLVEGPVTTGQWHQALDEPAISSRPAVGMSILENLQLAPNKEAKTGVDSPADESNDTEGNSIKVDQTFRGADLLLSSSVYIPAPLSAAAAAKSSPGKVVIPAVVDQMQQHALEALQALKVMDPDVVAGDICTRREYARWLIASSGRLARSTAHKVFPAMYIENVTEHAFDDLSAEDPDFPFIQGLAEAGLISSNLSKTGVVEKGMQSGVFFEPDSPLSRQDLVTWKVALDRHQLSTIDKEALQKESGFVDVDQIQEDAWPALMADLTAAKPSIIASAFGFTRRFQPEKPTTKGQAAIALASGDAADNVAEELARLEAKAMAEKAVAADIAMELHARRDISDNFNKQLQAEKEKREQAEKFIEEVKSELQKAKAERDEERYSVLKDRATLDSEKELLNVLRQQVDEQLQAFSGLRVEVAAEKERLEKLRVEREEQLKAISNYKLELEVERRALILVRSWAEDEAKQAQAQGQILEESRKRWENQGFEVDTDLNKDNNPEQNKDIRRELEDLFQQGPQQDVVGEDLKSQVNDAIIRSWQATTSVFSSLLHRVSSFLQEFGKKVNLLQNNVMSSAGERVQHVQEAVGKSTQDVQAAVGERVQGVQAAVGNKAQNLQATVATMSTNFAVLSKKFADNCKGEAEKLAQRFKHE